MRIVRPASFAAIGLSLALVLIAPAHAQRSGGKSVKGAADTTPPTLSLPANMRAEATAPGGAVVSVTATGTDDVDLRVTVTCTPASGKIFALGSTPVLCQARDRAGNRASGSFTVGVVDTIAPSILLPNTVTTSATDPSGVPVVFAVSASDRVDASAAAECTPASGSVFAPGTTAVRCGAADFSGDRSAGTFDVTVNAPVAEASAPVEAAPTVVTGLAVLSWSVPTTRADGQPLTMSELAGYEVHMLSESTGESRVITIDDPLSTARTIDGLTPDTHHFAVTAIDASGLISDLSSPVSKQIP